MAVDLAARDTRDVGVAVLAATGQEIRCELVRGLAAEIGRVPTADALADWLADLAACAGARLVLIDGPQAWKDPANGLSHQRACERELATQAKTGPPGVVKPGTQRRFVELSIALFDALAARGFARFDPVRAHARSAVEVFPTASWRRLETRPLPGKRGCGALELARCTAFLEREHRARFSAAPGHDELQACVAGLAGLALEGHARLRWRLFGAAPYEADGSWREGVIVLAEPANSSR